MKDDDFKLLRGFDYGQTDRRTTFVNVESLSRLKRINLSFDIYAINIKDCIRII